MQIFVGNIDRHTVVSHLLIPRITAQFVRIYPYTHHLFGCLRVEYYGCAVGKCYFCFFLLLSLKLSFSSYNGGQKSWDKFTFVAFFHTCQTNSQARIHLHIFSRSPHPPPHPALQCWTRAHAISLEVQHCMGGGGEGGKQRILKRNTVLF